MYYESRARSIIERILTPCGGIEKRKQGYDIITLLKYNLLLFIFSALVRASVHCRSCL